MEKLKAGPGMKPAPAVKSAEYHKVAKASRLRRHKAPASLQMSLEGDAATAKRVASRKQTVFRASRTADVGAGATYMSAPFLTKQEYRRTG